MKCIFLIAIQFLVVNSIIAQTLVEDFTMPTPLTSPEIKLIKITDNDKIVLSGWFDFYEGTEVPNLIRLNEDGSLNDSFTFDSDLSVKYFSFLQTGEIIALADTSILKIDVTGSIIKAVSSHSGFSFSNSASVIVIQDAIFILSDGKITKYNSDLEIDQTFKSDIVFSWPPSAIASQGNDKLLVLGRFDRVNGIEKNNIARFDLDGNLDLTFDVGSGTTARIDNLVVQPDEKILITDSYITKFSGSDFNGFVRLNKDGSIDTEFTPHKLNGSANSVTLHNGKIITIAFYNNMSRVFRLNYDGTLDNSFDIIDVPARSVAVHTDGRILASYQQGLIGIARYSTGGTLATDFNPPLTKIGYIDNAVFHDDYIVFTGNFHKMNELATAQIAKVNFKGVVDDGFVVSEDINNTGFNYSYVPKRIKIKSDDEIFVSTGRKLLKLNSSGKPVQGFITPDEVESRNGNSFVNRVDDFVFQSNNQIIVSSRYGIFRLNEDGTQDTSFYLEHESNHLGYDLEMYSDDKILIKGSNAEINGNPTNALVRFSVQEDFDVTFNTNIGSASKGRFARMIILSNDEIMIRNYHNSPGYSSTSNSLNIYKLGKDGKINEQFTENINATIPDDKLTFGGDVHNGNAYIFGYNSYTGSDIVLGKMDYSGNIDSNFKLAENYAVNLGFSINLKIAGSGGKHFLLFGPTLRMGSKLTNGFLFVDNNAPIISAATTSISTLKESPFPITLSDLEFTDTDNTLPSDFTLNIIEGENYTVSGNVVTPNLGFIGSLTVNVVVSDGIQDSDVFPLTVEVEKH